tara:strand:- start:1310 stop:1510 length:201 start_codon:yes stop_codon:yes gene_type:complete
MTNEEKASIYHSLLIRHDKIDGKVADIKSEAAGMELNDTQVKQLEVLEQQKSQVVSEAQSLFPDYK